MTQNGHKRARGLIDATRVAEISAIELDWLNAHLETCESCAEYLDTTQRIIQGLRSLRVQTNGTLVSRTQLSVRLRAHEMREHRDRMRLLWISCAMSLVMTTVSGSSLWQASEWLAHRWKPDWLWQLALLTFWFLPAMVTITACVWQRRSLDNREEVN